MKSAPVTELKNRLSHYLRLVAAGERVTITDHGRPIAQLIRAEPADADVEDLVGAGLARASVAPLSVDFLHRPLPRADLSAILAQDREDRI
jgi:prevent-host-death family protein